MAVVQNTGNRQNRQNNKIKEDLQYNLDLVNMWINNCDQKAGILLTIVGVVITVLLTSDFAKMLRNNIFMPFIKYIEDGNGSGMIFNIGRFSVFIFFVITSLFLALSCYNLFKVLKPDLDYSKIQAENREMVTKSYIFYASIASMSYEDFKQDAVDYKDDLKSQIYINSKIATNKFGNYTRGLFWFKFVIVSAAILFGLIMVMD